MDGEEADKGKGRSVPVRAKGGQPSSLCVAGHGQNQFGSFTMTGRATKPAVQPSNNVGDSLTTITAYNLELVREYDHMGPRTTSTSPIASTTAHARTAAPTTSAAKSTRNSAHGRKSRRRRPPTSAYLAWSRKKRNIEAAHSIATVSFAGLTHHNACVHYY